MEVVHVQPGDKQLPEAKIGDDLQRPIGHGAGIENAAADILAEAEHAALGGKDHAVLPAVVIPQRTAVDPGAVNLAGRVFDDRQSATDRRRAKAIENARHAVHGGKQRQPRPLNNVAHDLWAVIDKPPYPR